MPMYDRQYESEYMEYVICREMLPPYLHELFEANVEGLANLEVYDVSDPSERKALIQHAHRVTTPTPIEPWGLVGQVY